MFRIRKVYDASTPHNRERVAQVQAILRSQFPGISEGQIRKLPEQLTNPLKYQFRAELLVADLRDIIRSKEAADRPQDRAALPVIRRTLDEQEKA